MTKSNAPVEVLETQNSTQVSIQNLKEEVFANMTPLEMMLVLSRMQEDLLCSSITDEDNLYRNEIVIFSKAVTKMIIALKNNMNPKNVHVMELICGDE